MVVLALGAALWVLAASVVWICRAPERAASHAIEAQLGAGAYPAEFTAFYAQRNDAPLWLTPSGPPPFGGRLVLRPEAAAIARLAQNAGLPAGREAAQAIAHASSGDADDLARAELGASAALAAYVRTLGHPGAESLAFIDPDLAPPADAGEVLRDAAAAPSLKTYVTAVGEVNPIYRDLAAGLAEYRRTWSRLPQVRIGAGATLRLGDRAPRVATLRTRLGLSQAAADPDRFDASLAQAVVRFQSAHGLSPTGELDPPTVAALDAGPAPFEKLIAANLERARLLPPVLARRFILVNVAARELTVYEDGRPKHAMRVVVGARNEPTPMMVGQLRYLVFNPFWNIPVDLVRTSVAPRVLKEGLGYLRRANLEVLSGWDELARPIDPAQVDWQGVSQGWQELRVRQRPGGENMMGQVKFMAPNRLGIYLHDTPNKAAFSEPGRLLSAGCVRLEQAGTLAQWLLGAMPDVRRLRADQEAFLDEPVPLYITYLTAAPAKGGGVTFFPDVYGKDARSEPVAPVG